MRVFGPSPDWDRAYFAPRSDEPLCACAVMSRGQVCIIMPPATGTEEANGVLLARLIDRIERPILRPGERRKK